MYLLVNVYVLSIGSSKNFRTQLTLTRLCYCRYIGNGAIYLASVGQSKATTHCV